MTSLKTRSTAAFFAVAMVGASLAPPAAAAAGRLAIDDQLQRTPIGRILSLSDAGLSYEAASGATRTASAGRVVAVTEGGVSGVAPDPDRGWVDLIDGSRLVGEPAALASDGESFAWRHEDFGELRIGLDRVVRVVPPVAEGMERVAPGDGGDPLVDRVSLLNGDVLRGFVASVGDEVVVELESGGVASAALELVAEVRLANPLSAPAGPVVWLDDGSAISAASVIAAPDGRARIELAGGASATVDADRVVAMVFDAATLRALDAESIESWRTPPERRWSPPATTDPPPGSPRVAPLFAGDVLAPGPMTLAWTLPPGAERFGAVAQLAAGGQPWGDCEVIVRVDGREAARERLRGERPEVRLSVALDGAATLEIEIDAGRFGPVGDAVRLIDPLVLVRSGSD